MSNKIINIDSLKHYNDKINQIKQDVLISGQNIKTLNGESIIGEGDIKLEDSILSLTYGELVLLRDNSQLMPGQQYRITDYVTTTIQENTQSASYQFDVIVTADDENTLNEVARAIQHDGDTYFANSDLNAWQICYSIDNDIERFAWADATNGKGVIYRMIDEWGNDCPYDFKNIQFKHPNDITKYPDYYYTFSTVINGVVTDHSLLQGYCYSNTIKEYITSKKQTLNNNVFLNTSKTSSCDYNSFGNSCYYNSFGDGCGSNSFENNCFSNYFGDSCDGNYFENFCYSNSFGNSCYYNSFGDGCYYNSFGNSCDYNSFGDSCIRNSFGNSCDYNSFGDEYYANSFGDDCEHNSFGDDCNSNSFGNSCNSNSFGNNCSSNSFGNNCSSNSFRRNSSTAASLKAYCYYNHFDDGCSYNVIWNSDTTSSGLLLKNINVNRGVSGTSSLYNHININTLNSKKEININNYNGNIYIDYGDIFKVTYSELVDLRDNSQLIPGRQYRIIDYVTTTSQENTISAGHPFDVIVTALNEYTLSEEAQAIQNINDRHGYFDESNISAWKIWYSLDNDITRFKWAGDKIITSEEVETTTYDSSECTIKSELIDDNVFITPFNFESCVWVDTDSDYNDGDNHDTYELIYEWGYFTDENDNTHLCLYKSNADLYEEEGQPDYGDKYLYRGVVNVDGEEYDYWQKWDENSESINVNGDGYVYATTPRIVSNPEEYSCETTTETIETVISLDPKGVIYRMIDAFNNDCPYDFKNIQFKHPNDNITYPDYYYTFSLVSNSGAVADHSLVSQGYCYDNTIKEYITLKRQTLNNNVFLNTSKTRSCYGNSFGNDCYNNSFGNSCYSNSFGTGCYSNSFGNDWCYNSFGLFCEYNSLGNYGQYNYFGDYCQYNSFGNYCNQNSFGENCYQNVFGNSCQYNSFGNNCGYNSFGSLCQRNSFGNFCEYNSLGNNCGYNSFGNSCQYNSFGNSCQYNSFRVSTNVVSLHKAYVQYNHFDDGCKFNVIWNADTTSSSILLKNINVNRGVSGTSSSYNYINIDVLNQDYEIQVAKNSNGEIKIYCEADLIA